LSGITALCVWWCTVDDRNVACSLVSVPSTGWNSSGLAGLLFDRLMGEFSLRIPFFPLHRVYVGSVAGVPGAMRSLQTFSDVVPST
jgi:hypothetical protein